MTDRNGQVVAYCGSEATWVFVCRALAKRPIEVHRYAADQPCDWTTGRFELVITDVATDDNDTLERLRFINRWRAGAPLVVLYGHDAGAEAAAARLGGDEGVVIRRCLPGLVDEENSFARFVETLVAARPAA